MKMATYQSLLRCGLCTGEHLQSLERYQHSEAIDALREHPLVKLFRSTFLKTLFSSVSPLLLFCGLSQGQATSAHGCSNTTGYLLHFNVPRAAFLLLILPFATSTQATLWNCDSCCPAFHNQLFCCHMDPVFANFPDTTGPSTKQANGKRTAYDLNRNAFPPRTYSVQPNRDISSDYKWKPWPTLNEPFDAEIPLPSFSSSPQLEPATDEYQRISTSPGQLAQPSNLPEYENSRCPVGNCPFESPAETVLDGGLVSLGLYTNPEEILASNEQTTEDSTRFPEGRGLLLEESFDPPEHMNTTISGRDQGLRERNHCRRLREGWARHQLGEEALPLQGGHQEDRGDAIMLTHPPVAEQPPSYMGNTEIGNTETQQQMQGPFYPQWQEQAPSLIGDTWNQQMQGSIPPQQRAPIPAYMNSSWNQQQMQAPYYPQAQPQIPGYMANAWDQQMQAIFSSQQQSHIPGYMGEYWNQQMPATLPTQQQSQIPVYMDDDWMQTTFPSQPQPQIPGYMDDSWNQQQIQASDYPQAEPQILDYQDSAWNQQQMPNLYPQVSCSYPSFSDFPNMQ